MNIIIQKLKGSWHSVVGSFRIRSPFLEMQNRAFVVASARRVYAGAKIFKHD